MDRRRAAPDRPRGPRARRRREQPHAHLGSSNSLLTDRGVGGQKSLADREDRAGTRLLRTRPPPWRPRHRPHLPHARRRLAHLDDRTDEDGPVGARRRRRRTPECGDSPPARRHGAATRQGDPGPRTKGDNTRTPHGRRRRLRPTSRTLNRGDRARLARRLRNRGPRRETLPGCAADQGTFRPLTLAWTRAMTDAAAYGVRSMTTALRRVLVGSPARSGDFAAAGWRAPEFELLQGQHQAFVELIDSLGVEVVVLPATDGLVDACFVYDPVFVTGAGQLVLRMRKPARVGEPERLAAALEEMGVPVAGRLDGGAYADGGDMFWLDERTLAVGRGYRTNAEAHR